MEPSAEDIIARKIPEQEVLEKETTINFKIIIIGDSGVGKSCLLRRAVQNTFTNTHTATIGFEFLLMYYDVNGTKMKLQIWDTCGQEMYRSLIQGFYRNTALTIMIYSIDNKDSFLNLSKWLKDVRNNSEKDQPVFIVGNKCDLEKKNVSSNEAEKFVEENGLYNFIETSAATGENVSDLFDEVAKCLYKMYNATGKFQLKKLKLGDSQNSIDSDQLIEKKKNRRM